jgi:hypothetical protein
MPNNLFPSSGSNASAVIGKVFSVVSPPHTHTPGVPLN